MPQLSNMIPIGDVFVPEVPADIRATGVDGGVLTDLALKLAYTTTQFTTEWASQRLCLSLPLIKEILEDLRSKQMLETLGASGAFGYRYGISRGGRERAARLFEVSAYVGPAPVSLEAYAAMIEWQVAHHPVVTPESVAAAISELEIPDDARHMAGLAVSSGRSLFVFGPAGNGKTTLGRLLHNVLQGDLWVPHCIVVDNSIIQVALLGAIHLYGRRIGGQHSLQEIQHFLDVRFLMDGPISSPVSGNRGLRKLANLITTRQLTPNQENTASDRSHGRKSEARRRQRPRRRSGRHRE